MLLTSFELNISHRASELLHLRMASQCIQATDTICAIDFDQRINPCKVPKLDAAVVRERHYSRYSESHYSLFRAEQLHHTNHRNKAAIPSTPAPTNGAAVLAALPAKVLEEPDEPLPDEAEPLVEGIDVPDIVEVVVVWLFPETLLALMKFAQATAAPVESWITMLPLPKKASLLGSMETYLST